MKIRTIVIAFFISLSASCATIVGEPTQLLPITSTPEGASVVITDETGAQIFSGTTPTSVTLEKSDGSYWGGKSFKVVISKEGYDTIETPIETSPSGWYIGGNLLFGGLIGWFIVDPLSGDMYTLSQDKIEATLTSSSAHNGSHDKQNVSIVLLDNVPENLRSELVKLN